MSDVYMLLPSLYHAKIVQAGRNETCFKLPKSAYLRQK